MRRRTYLAGLSTAAAGVAGCAAGDGNPDVVLSEPDREFESADLPYPAWGERVPDVSLPAVHADGTVDLRAVERPALLTFFYSHCRTVCPVLVGTLRNVQTHALNEGYGDAVRFYPVTFDPARDDADRLRAYADERNVALGAANWQFLRPASAERAEAVVADAFGVAFQRTEPPETDGYMFTHTAMTILVNADGYVERAYRTKSPDPDELIDDLAAVREA
ncbi:SCO family protein [Halosimplex halobium]|uniref:SCO family protein n=1 Tax=Halosimplex halobium TaxID=3396618 RepID=UPI003F55BDC0